MRITFAAALTTTMAFVASASGADFFVDATKPPGGNGLTWQFAFNNLQDALDAAQQQPTADVIWIASADEHEYLPDTNSPGDRSASFSIPPNTDIYGGFIGNESDVDQRDPVANPTILSGDIDPSGNLDSYTVLAAEGLSLNRSRIFGLTIRNGRSDGSGATPRESRGGALFLEGSNFDVTNCIFENNCAEEGGAVGTDGNETKEIRFVNCVFRDNESNSTGGACWLRSNSTFEFTNCLFHDNEASGLGGAIYSANSTFQSVFVSLINCTIASNVTSASSGGGVYHVSAGTVTHEIENCILWGNTDNGMVDEAAQIGWAGAVPFAIEHTCIEGLSVFNIPGSGNIGADPQFFDPATDAYQIRSTSPCRDPGDQAFLPADTADLDRDGDVSEDVPLEIRRRTRVVPSRVDMGAFEKGGPCPADIDDNDEVDAEDLLILLAAREPSRTRPRTVPADLRWRSRR